MNPNFEWNRILLNDHNTEFLLEVVIRTIVMFIIILGTLRASGKRGIRQLSIFELVLIIGLGSAAGDPMFYEDVGLLPALTVFIVVISLYIGVTKLTDKFVFFERFLEGKPVYVMENGQLNMDSFKSVSLSKDEFFAELRLQNVEHLGQVKTVLIETSGDCSILFYPDEEVKEGLPIFPRDLEQNIERIPKSGVFACFDCGILITLPEGDHICLACEGHKWVKPMNTKRHS